MRTIAEILYVTEDNSVSPTKWVLSWKRPDFQVNSEYESEEISEKDALTIIKSLKTCNHKWETTLTNKKQFNYCTECKMCEVLLRQTNIN